MKKEKGTLSILENIRRKMQKIEGGSEAKTNLKTDDDFQYIDDTSKTAVDSKREKNAAQNLDPLDQDFNTSSNAAPTSSAVPNPTSAQNDIHEETPLPVNDHHDDDLDFLGDDLSEESEEDKNNEAEKDLSPTSPIENQPSVINPPAPSAPNAPMENAAKSNVVNTSDVEDDDLDFNLDDLDEDHNLDGHHEEANKPDQPQINMAENAAMTNVDVPQAVTPEAVTPAPSVPEPKKGDLDDLDDLDLDLDDHHEEEKPAAKDSDLDDLDDLDLDLDDHHEENKAAPTVVNQASSVQPNVVTPSQPEAPKVTDNKKMDDDLDLDDLDIDDFEDKNSKQPAMEIPKPSAPTQPSTPQEISSNKTENATPILDEDLNELEGNIDHLISKSSDNQTFTTPPSQAKKPSETYSYIPEQNNRVSMNDVRKGNLISEKVINEASGAIKKLVDAIPKKQQVLFDNSPAFRSGETIEDMISAMLAPRLEQWMNENLPTLVERVVREEIKKIIPRDE